MLDIKADDPIFSSHKPSQCLGFSGEENLIYNSSEHVMKDCAKWINMICNDLPILISDHHGFDWMFVCWSFHHLIGSNPFGLSS